VTAPFQEWFKEALPAIIFQHIIQAKAVKVCSSISPIFGVIARYYGYETYVITAPGHKLNVVITPEGPVEIDLSAIQFKVCDFVEEEDTTPRDPYGVKKALKRVLRYIIRDPNRAVKIQPYEGPMSVLEEPRVNELYYQYYLDSFKSALEDIEALRRKDPEVYELHDDIRFLEEWEVDVRQNPRKKRLKSTQRICASCKELKPHYMYKLCYLCYRNLQCRWLDDIEEWFDALEKPQCQNLMFKMGFCEEHWDYIQDKERERKKRDAQQRNPEYSKPYYEGYEEPTTFGYTQKEIYKIILFADYLPQEEERIIRGNKWLIKNRHKLPVDIQEMRLQDIFLTVRTSEYREIYVWNLTYHEDGPRLGGGIFCDSSKGPPGYKEPGYHEDCTAGISLQGFGLYPTIIKFMRGLLGPLRSDLTLTSGAMRAWIKAGGVSRSSPDSRISAAENRRWYLD